MAGKFYKAIVQVEVLSETPIDFENLATLASQMDDGDWVGTYKIKEHKTINSKQAVRNLRKVGSDPSFFMLDNKGKRLKI